MIFGLAKALKARGVLGLNARNGKYILPHNPRKLYPIVDDKLLTKELAIKHGVAVPELYGVIASQHDSDKLDTILQGRQDFVIKPAQGSGGDGILVITGRSRDHYRQVNGDLIAGDTLQYHISNILSGMFSLGGHEDKALIEYRVQFDPIFDQVAYLGVPDIRIIVFLGVPVMAMIRLPTRLSRGKANLHQGAIGVGINLADGVTTSGVWGNSPISEHPDTSHSIHALQIPHWDQLLQLASQCYDMTGLGYLGVDIVLDKLHGPLILELNARPGLNIQIANNAGLEDRLERVARNQHDFSGIEDRLVYAKTYFRQ